MRSTLLVPILLLAQAQPPSPQPDIYLAPLTWNAATPSLGAPANVTNGEGYDNQPSFTPDGAAMLFASERSRVVTAPVEGAPAALPQTDVYRYDLTRQAIEQVTDTRLREYSPTVTPDGRGISVIRVEADGTQRLWRFPIAGGEPTLILTDVKPVGYHAWIDARRLALFVLGEQRAPATLQIADTTTGKAEVVATDIGRSLLRAPSGRITFVQRERGEGSAARTLIKEFDPAASGDARIRTLTEAVAGAAQPDLAWAPNGALLTAHDGKLYMWREGAKGWTVVSDLAAAGLRGVSRLAVSPKGDWLAIVADGR